MYYTLIKNIYDPTSYFTLALFSTHCLHDGELFKISLNQLNLEFSMCNAHAKNNKILYEIRDLFNFANYFHYGIIIVYHSAPRAFQLPDIMSIYHESDGDGDRKM